MAYYLLGFLLRITNRVEEALKYYEQMLIIDENYYWGLFGLGYSF